MKPLWELELSNDLKERQLFVKKVKEAITTLEERLSDLDEWHGIDRALFIRQTQSDDTNISKIANEIIKNIDEYYAKHTHRKLIEHERSFLQFLKSKLDSFDVYNQQFSKFCNNCKELKRHCVCDVLS